MRDIKYVIHREGEHFVAQCLNVDVSSFGNSVDDAIKNIVEAVELYFEDNDFTDYIPIDIALIGENSIDV
jgi:predicted RNase H-like HicB family nuclease